MKLDPYIMDLLRLFEANSADKLYPYQLMYEMIRGEIKAITWVPNLEVDSNGQLARLDSQILVEYYEHEEIKK